MTDNDSLPADEALVRNLLSGLEPLEFGAWAQLPVQRLVSSGTDNALFRIGNDLVLRLPRRRSAIALAAKELDWLPHLAGLPLEIPTLRYRGMVPNEPGIDRAFGICDWMEGEIAVPRAIADPREAALSLAAFLKALHQKDTTGAPPAGACNSRRGIALAELTDITLPAIEIVADEVDILRAKALWEEASSQAYDGLPRWLHGDLKADNLIARHGKLTGVIDWGLSAVGDPAADYASAWSWVDPSARETFRDACSLTDADWLRGRGWALYGAVIALSYYRGGRNEALCRQSRLTLSRLGLLL
ncbi:aminoglycoside phosphotransferase family protein [Neorhizobium alkalisoli]|uniref:Aminoglycoside phosphotransferase (APT) family kinase protein n=1 Tax=Neorhizobium alkalisoli TaxID=528178 RepID=A0A561QWJ8_9HYPH|nr:aminoglycoside phosphotransferase family protein [Neorhizobium alkalisoli]TWF54743.1 aminoglycoside phosphotransferase (APT) family kinase protein [Neorhizobium alkalisoli]